TRTHPPPYLPDPLPSTWHIAPLYGPAAGGKKGCSARFGPLQFGGGSPGCVRLSHERGSDQPPRIASADEPRVRRPALRRRGAGRAEEHTSELTTRGSMV